MFRQAFIGVAALAAILAGLIAFWSTAAEKHPVVYGRNNTVLFITDNHHGLSNVHVATSFALLENHPDIEIHYASFPKLRTKIERVSKAGQARNAAAKPIQWHTLPGLNYVDAVMRTLYHRTSATGDMTTNPGVRGIEKLVTIMDTAVAPWTPEEHYDLLMSMRNLIEEVNPNVVVTDPLVYASLEASRGLNRSTAMISPNDLPTILGPLQPRGAVFWKYPAVGTGFQFPVPMRNLPENIYVMYRLAKQMLSSPLVREKRAYLASKGITETTRFDPIGYEDLPWISPGFPEGGFPIDYIPPHVVACGPIALDVASVKEQDPELTIWLKRGPTMLINLGSGYYCPENNAQIMAESLVPVFEQTDVQVLWKLIRLDGYNDDFAKSVKEYIDNGRLRIESWLDADPLSIMKSGDVVASVHHAAAGAYFETILAGIPHVVLPLWVDHYNLASMTEYLGIGIWPGRDKTPEWTPAALSDGYLHVLKGNESIEIRDKSKSLAKIAASYGGRNTAAAKVASLAREGH